MRVWCGSRRGWCMLFINILDSLTAPCFVYNMAMYTVYSLCGQYDWCMVHTLAGAAGAWLYGVGTISTLDYSYPRLFVSYSYRRPFVPRTICPQDHSYPM